MKPKQVSDTWEQGDSYERYIGRWSRKIAPLFLSWFNDQPGQRWLDVGCGTGALCDAIVKHCSPRLVVGLDPSLGFLRAAARHLAGQVAFFQSTGIAIALGPQSVDAVVSGLALNFIPDPRSALLDMASVSHLGGTIGAYVWDYASKMEPIRFLWDAAAEIDPNAARLDEGVRFPVCQPDALSELFASVGLQEVKVEAIDLQTTFVNFEDYWQPILGGQGPAPAYVMAMNDDQRTRLRDRLFARMPIQADGSIRLIARAWAVRGRIVSRIPLKITTSTDT